MNNDIITQNSNIINGSPIHQYPKQATNDDQIIDLWLFGKSKESQRAYLRDIKEVLSFIPKPLNQIILRDLQQYSTFLEQKELAPRSRQRKLAAIKSLMSFATKLGYLSFDIGKPLKLPSIKNDLARRILDEATVVKIIHSEKDPRNKLFLKASYLLGARVSEMVHLTWDDLAPSADNCTVTLFGKGGKTRHVLISLSLYLELADMRNGALGSQPVFVSKKTKKHLDTSQAFRIVQRAARTAGIGDRNISPHWFRHAHASHALAKGAPMPLIQRDLGHSSLAITGRYLHVKPTDGSGLWLSV